MRAAVAPDRALAKQQLEASFKVRALYPLKVFKKMLGLMASATPVLQLGLLRMRPLQYWLKPLIPLHTWHHGRIHVRVSQACIAALPLWKNPQWFKQGVVMGMVYRRKVVSTNASNTGWGALCEGNPTFGSWSIAESRLHINWLEMMAVFRALQTFLPDLKGHHMLVCSDSMTVVAYINSQGRLTSKHLFEMVRHLLEWANLNLRSLRAAHVPGVLNQDQWMLQPQKVQEI